jgi:hypothetical protein
MIGAGESHRRKTADSARTVKLESTTKIETKIATKIETKSGSEPAKL